MISVSVSVSVHVLFHLIASYPKSGNTYTRIFLAHYLKGETNLNQIGWPLFPSKYFFPFGLEYKRKVRPFNEFIFSKTHEIASQYSPRYCGKCLYIARNPYDVVPSLARHMAVDIEHAIRTLRKFNGGLKGNERIYPQIIGSWGQNVRSWLTEKRFPVYAIQYESLVANPRMAFSGILNFFNIPINETRLEASIRFTAFDNLRTIENRMLESATESKDNKRAFKEARGATGKFFNVGRSGNGREVLTKDQMQRIYKDNGSLMELLGYSES